MKFNKGGEVQRSDLKTNAMARAWMNYGVKEEQAKMGLFSGNKEFLGSLQEKSFKTSQRLHAIEERVCNLEAAMPDQSGLVFNLSHTLYDTSQFPKNPVLIMYQIHGKDVFMPRDTMDGFLSALADIYPIRVDSEYKENSREHHNTQVIVKWMNANSEELFKFFLTWIMKRELSLLDGETVVDFVKNKKSEEEKNNPNGVYELESRSGYSIFNAPALSHE